MCAGDADIEKHLNDSPRISKTFLYFCCVKGGVANSFAENSPGMYALLFGNGNPDNNYVYTSDQYYNIPFVNTAIASPLNPLYEVGNVVQHDLSGAISSGSSSFNNTSNAFGDLFKDVGKGVSDAFNAGNTLTTGLGVLSGAAGLLLFVGGGYLLAKNQGWIK